MATLPSIARLGANNPYSPSGEYRIPQPHRRLNVLFICSRNRWRSPTAELLWRESPLLNVRSAGTSASARHTVNEQDLQWADLILVMESRHLAQLRKRFGRRLSAVRVEVLHILDEYPLMDPDFIHLLRCHVARLLGSDAARHG